MKKPSVLAILSAFLAFTALVSFPTAGAQQREWKGKVETADGVKVVKNPREPLYGTIKLDIAEDLSIGTENDSNLMFFGVRDITVDKQGNIYVLDMKNYRIQKFDKAGKYLLTIGRKGQGPGEFELPVKVLIDDGNGDIYVKDLSTTLKIFDKDGRYLNRDIHSKPPVMDFLLDEDKNIMAVIWKSSEAESTNTHALGKINSKGDILGVYGEFPYNIFMKKEGEGTLVVSTGYELSVQLAKLDSGTFVCGYPKTYELKVIDKNGKALYKITVDEPVPEFSSKEKASFKKIPPPSQKPYFFSIFTDSIGCIYVQRNMAATGRGPVERENKDVDVFNKEGHFIFTTTLPPNTCVIKDGYIYGYAVDEDKGMEYAKRYKIKNWEELGKYGNITRKAGLEESKSP
jgi:hypothetical protein